METFRNYAIWYSWYFDAGRDTPLASATSSEVISC